mgnify:FL=1
MISLDKNNSRSLKFTNMNAVCAEIFAAVIVDIFLSKKNMNEIFEKLLIISENRDIICSCDIKKRKMVIAARRTAFMEENRTYIAIDLKSFYASVECTERGLDPLTTNLVVADRTRTDKTICLAVSPSLKAYGIPGRARLFEVVQRIKGVNDQRRRAIPNRRFTGRSYVSTELAERPSYEVDYIVAPPQMAKYMEVSSRIYQIYLRHIAPEDIHVYSIDEVFIDATCYLKTYRMTAHELAIKLIREVLAETGITATAGIGTNMFLCKVAMDIVAKKIPADKDGVRIAQLDEMSFRQTMWTHTPLTDFWRIGHGIAARLEAMGMKTLGDVAEMSINNEEILYKAFGVNAELIIDHAWGYEPTLISDIKAYRPSSSSVSMGQVLTKPYTAEMGRLIVREMSELLSLDLVGKSLVTGQIVLSVGYDNTGIPRNYHGELVMDHYGRPVPKAAHGTINLDRRTSSTRLIMQAVAELYDRIVDSRLFVRRVNIVAAGVIPGQQAEYERLQTGEQLDMFTDYDEENARREREEKALEKEHNVQQALLEIKRRYGKNSVIKGMNLEQGATTVERNRQIGGHKA